MKNRLKELWQDIDDLAFGCLVAVAGAVFGLGIIWAFLRICSMPIIWIIEAIKN